MSLPFLLKKFPSLINFEFGQKNIQKISLNNFFALDILQVSYRLYFCLK